MLTKTMSSMLVEGFPSSSGTSGGNGTVANAMDIFSLPTPWGKPQLLGASCARDGRQREKPLNILRRIDAAFLSCEVV